MMEPRHIKNAWLSSDGRIYTSRRDAEYMGHLHDCKEDIYGCITHDSPKVRHAVVERLDLIIGRVFRYIVEAGEIPADIGGTIRYVTDEPEWIEWYGGARPVAGYAVVEVKFRNWAGPHVIDAGFHKWEHSYGDKDIVAYRVLKR